MSTIKHIEIAGVDGEKLQQFYAKLFGWDMNRRNVGGFDYFDVDDSGSPSLGIRHEPEGYPEIVVYVEVENLDQSVKEAEALGATLRIPPIQHDDILIALIKDPEGNPIGLTQTQPEDRSK